MKQLILLMAGFAAFHAAAAGHSSAVEADFPAVCATAADSLPPVDTRLFCRDRSTADLLYSPTRQHPRRTLYE